MRGVENTDLPQPSRIIPERNCNSLIQKNTKKFAQELTSSLQTNPQHDFPWKHPVCPQSYPQIPWITLWYGFLA